MVLAVIVATHACHNIQCRRHFPVFLQICGIGFCARIGAVLHHVVFQILQIGLHTCAQRMLAEGARIVRPCRLRTVAVIGACKSGIEEVLVFLVVIINVGGAQLLVLVNQVFHLSAQRIVYIEVLILLSCTDVAFVVVERPLEVGAQLIRKCIAELLRGIPNAVSVNRRRARLCQFLRCGAVGIDNRRHLSLIVGHGISVTRAIGDARQGRETVLPGSCRNGIFLSVASGIACTQVSRERAVGTLRDDVHHSTQRIGTIDCRLRPPYHFDALYIIYVKAGKVHIVVCPLTADTFAVYEEQYIFALHTLVLDFRYLAHRVIHNLQTRKFVLQQRLHALRVQRLNIFLRNDARQYRRIFQRALYPGTGRNNLIKFVLCRIQPYTG